MTSDSVFSATQPNLLQITQCLTELISDVEKVKRFGSLQLEDLGLQLKDANLELDKSRDLQAKISLERDSKLEELKKLHIDYEKLLIEQKISEEKISDLSKALRLKSDQCQEIHEINKKIDDKFLLSEKAVEERDKQLVDKQKELDAAVEERDKQLVDKQKELDAAVEERDKQLVDKQKQLDAAVHKRDLLATEKRLLQEEMDDLRRNNDVQLSELKIIKDQSDNMILHLHQVQEELDHYYQLCRQQSEMLTAQNNLNERMVSLISAVNL